VTARRSDDRLTLLLLFGSNEESYGVRMRQVFTHPLITFPTIVAIVLAAALAMGVRSVAASDHCIATGYMGLTANVVNEDLDGGDTIEVTCDVGAFFDESGSVSGATILGTVAEARPKQFGILVVGANVDVRDTNVSVEAAYPHQFVSIAYHEGATGTISGNTISGAHRAGVLIRGAGTDVTVRGNSVIGSGPKTSGWAENGIQVDQGANADIVNNTVSQHWWDGESNFGSTGIMVLVDGARVTNNVLEDNEFGIYVTGDDAKVTSNQISSSVVSQSSFQFRAWGVLLAGSKSHLAGNRMTALDGAAGIYIFPGADKNRITGNRISGFEEAIVDGGTDTMARGNPTPAN